MHKLPNERGDRQRVYTLDEADALGVLPEISAELEESESCPEKEGEPTATTKRAAMITICGCLVSGVGPKRHRRVSEDKFF